LEVVEVSAIAEAKASVTTGDKTLVIDFIADCGLRGMSSESIRSYRSNLLIFHAFLKREGFSVLRVDKDVLRSFLGYLKEERKVSHKRMENYFSSLSSFYEYLAYEGYVPVNPVLPVRKRYLRTYKKGEVKQAQRKLISVEEMSVLVNSIINVRDRALVTLFAKTGIRRGELIRIDVDDIDWEGQSITLKPMAKRSNRVVFFDGEAARVLRDWLRVRGEMHLMSKALFVGERGGRLQRNGVYTAVTRWAEKVGLHDPVSPRLEDHFTPHCCRHWFTTHLRRSGMPREFIMELRGDKRRDAIDIYDHIDGDELRRAYLAYIPRLFIA
jgi:integrase/recombinase XerD